MGEKQRTKEQHTVPQSYLKAFAIEGLLFVLDIRKIQKGFKEFPRKQSPKSICYDLDFYTIKSEYPDHQFNLKKYDPYFIEDKVLTGLENKYPLLLERITNLNAIDIHDALDFSDFIIALKLRNPYWLNNTLKKNRKAWSERLIPEAIDNFKKDNPDLPDDLLSILSDELFQQSKNQNYDKQSQLFTLVERYTNNSGRNKQLREKTMDCSWYLYEAPKDGPYFITTDNPGVAMDTTDQSHHNIKLDGGFVFYFPLSPRYSLVFGDAFKDYAFTNNASIKNISPISVTNKMVIQINNLLAQVANKKLIASDSTYLNQIAQLNKP